jgi:hypothetical protein
LFQKKTSRAIRVAPRGRREEEETLNFGREAVVAWT